MKQTWRWFGPADPIKIGDLLQIGVEGVVTALHDKLPGAVWTVKDIQQRQQEVATLADGRPSGLAWDVVESLPVSESIKTQTGNWQEHIDAYNESLHNLAECGLRTVCYNFMPVLDWTRTSLRSVMPHGGAAMRFDVIDFAVFDVHLLRRKNARADYDHNIAELAEARFRTMPREDLVALESNIVAGLPGSNDRWTLADVRALLDTYRTVDADQLRANLVAFLEQVVPTAQQLEVNLCCHPDDPPFSLMGLPRVMSRFDDYGRIMKSVDVPQNGITLCTGSLGVNPSLNFAKFITEWGHRIHFVHLRNTMREGPRNRGMHSFFEAEHLGGDTDMVAVVRALMDEEDRRRATGRTDSTIPMRPDHGQEILDDLTRHSLPGYPLVGRARGLAELRGVMTALGHTSGRSGH
ncbi:mannonate dehydratase [Rhizobiaceae bacterium]|nr:mannonate dehydratase [Rhizobiaceae bacterium]